MMELKIEHKETYHKITIGESSWIISKKRWYDFGTGVARSVYASMSILCAGMIGHLTGYINTCLYPNESVSLSLVLTQIVACTIVMCLTFLVVADSTTWTYKNYLKRKREKELKRKKAK